VGFVTLPAQAACAPTLTCKYIVSYAETCQATIWVYAHWRFALVSQDQLRRTFPEIS
jgi:hypothetical protein